MNLMTNAPAGVDFYSANSAGIYVNAGGSVAQRLTSSHMQTGVLRPFIWRDGNSYISVNGSDDTAKSIKINTTATLRYDEWKTFDEAVVQISRNRLSAATDLESRGLTKPISNGMGSTVLQWETVSDVNDADMDMAAQKQGEEDRPVYETNYLPLPIIHKSFSISLRNLEESRKSGDPIDTTWAEAATRKVSEKVEDIILLGSSTFAFGGGTIYGYMDHPNINTVTLAANWDDSGTSGEEILNDVLSMTKAATNANHYGPFILYIPTDYDDILANDFKSNSDKSIRTRLMELTKISDIRAVDRLTADTVLLVEMSPETVKLVKGMPIQMLQWEEQGGLLLKFKIMTIMVPWIRPDQEGNLGIVKLAA